MKPRRALFSLLCLASSLWFSPGVAAEQLIALVVHAGFPEKNLAPETIKLIYLRKQMLDGSGGRWIPLNLPSTHEIRRAFSLALLKKYPEELESYWNEQYFQGLSPPQILASEEAVLRFVAITPGAIGYVRAELADERVKIVYTLSVP